MYWWIFLALVFVKACIADPILAVALLILVPLAIWMAHKMEGMPDDGPVYDDSFENFVPMPADAPYDDSFENLVEMPYEALVEMPYEGYVEVPFEELVPMPADGTYDDNFEKP